MNLDLDGSILLLGRVISQAMEDCLDPRLEDEVIEEAKAFLLDLGASFLVGQVPIHFNAGYSTETQESIT